MLDLTEEFEFQSTLPVWGATWRALREYRLHRHFNPRSPCGERPSYRSSALSRFSISIHAPRVGSDGTGLERLHRKEVFQSTLPVWGATPMWWTRSNLKAAFQSTLPVWGATPIAGYSGYDDSFQSTLPVWGATGLAAENGVILDISIHAPRVGSDVRLVHQKEEDKISIHAPRVGSDGKILASYHIITSYFNPRSPCGERRLFRPMRIPACRRISIHAPRVGSDCRRAYAELGGVKFQSTLPVWGATFNSKIPP